MSERGEARSPRRPRRGSAWGRAPARPPHLSAPARWLSAPLLVALAAVVQWLTLVRPDYVPFVFFYLAVALVGWVGGRGPSLLAVAVSVITADYFFFGPAFGWSIDAPSLRADLFFVLGSTPIALLSAALREALLEADRTANALRRQSDLLQLSQDAIFVWRLDGAIETWNRGAEELYGYGAEEAVGRASHDLLRTVFPIPLADLQEALRREGRFQGRLRHTTKDGRVVVVFSRLQLVHGGEDGAPRVLESTRDITQGLEAEDRFHALADNIAQLAWMADASGSIFWFNQRWLEYTGTTLDDAQGPGWQEVHHPEHVGRVVEKLARCFAAGEPWEDTFPLRGADGAYRWFLSRAVPIRDEAGQVVRWFGTHTDVTEQREAAQRKDAFLAVLSHELRNPLAPIKNSLHLLRRVDPGSPVGLEAQAVLERQVAHLSRLVDDLLDVSRISRGKIQVRHDPVDLAQVVGRVVEDHRSVFAARGIALICDLPAHPVAVRGDADRLAQVVSNLLLNAAKFTPKHGRVDVSLHVAAELATIRVRDTGVGIPAAMLARIFEPFTQGEQALDRRAGGLGLGLALVEELMAQHGGAVEAQSDGPGRGAELIARLPLDPAAVAPVSRVTAVGGAGGRRVLIIEDNVDAAESLREALTLDAYQVAVAFDGPEGLVQARDFRPDVVLCDIGLPGMDGYAVARALREDPALRDVGLVALTGYALDRDQQLAAEAGFDRHLAKPPDLGALERLLDELPPRRAA